MSRGTQIDSSIEYVAFIVWELQGDRPIMVAIDTSPERAAQHVAAVKHAAQAENRPPPETFVEETLLNHFYGKTVTDLPSFKIAVLAKKWNL